MITRGEGGREGIKMRNKKRARKKDGTKARWHEYARVNVYYTENRDARSGKVGPATFDRLFVDISAMKRSSIGSSHKFNKRIKKFTSFDIDKSCPKKEEATIL